MTIMTDYIILFYGFGIPLFYIIHKLTIGMMDRRERKKKEKEFNMNYGQIQYPYPQQPMQQQPMQQPLPIITNDLKYDRMKDIILNDNMSTQDRITATKNIIKKK